jgi:Spy/CpxP family protein refolding chaperone
MKKGAVIVVVAVAALSMAAVGFSVASGSASQQVATPACQQQKGQCEHQPGSLACREAHANGQCDHGPGPCDPANCDPAKCDGKCGRHGGGCDPAKCDPAKCIGDGSGCLIQQRLLAKLNLTTEQQQAVDAARAQLRQQVNELRQQLSAEREKLADLWSAPEPDDAAIAAQRDKVSALRKQVRERVAAHLLEVRGLLTPDQQTKFDAAVRHCPLGRDGDGCDPAKCDPAKCDPDKCTGHDRPCNPADCAGHSKDDAKPGCGGHSRGGHPGCAGHGANDGE